MPKIWSGHDKLTEGGRHNTTRLRRAYKNENLNLTIKLQTSAIFSIACPLKPKLLSMYLD